MSEFQAYFTNDGSVGLYNKDYDDIYHSASGALTEAYEKFVCPVNWDNLLKYDDIKVLDICYGIGYNTKSFLNYIFENKKKLLKIKNEIKKIFSKNFSIDKNIDTIHTDNIYSLNNQNNIDKIYTNNIFNNISVTALDNDEILTGLSPFIKTGVKNFKKNHELIDKLKLNKYFSDKPVINYKINNSINYEILSQLLEKKPQIFNNDDLLKVLSDKSNSSYFIAHLKNLFFSMYKNTHKNINLLNLHNIYYRYLTNCYKNELKNAYIQKINFNVKINDARLSVKEDKNIYNLIFLDAFTPSKCPCLWSFDFFKELYSHLSEDGMLLTYSSAAQVRNAMIAAGFAVGKIFNTRLNKFQGTVAVKNIDLIKHPLSESDLGLLKTKAGIFYRDRNLSSQNEAIIMAHKTEVENSNLMSSSMYLKTRRKNVL